MMEIYHHESPMAIGNIPYFLRGKQVKNQTWQTLLHVEGVFFEGPNSHLCWLLTSQFLLPHYQCCFVEFEKLPAKSPLLVL